MSSGSQAFLGRGALGSASIKAGDQEQSLSNISKARHLTNAETVEKGLMHHADMVLLPRMHQKYSNYQVPVPVLCVQDLGGLCETSKELRSVLSGQTKQVWLQDRQAISAAGLSTSAFLPAGVECLLAQHVAQGQSAQEGSTATGGLILLFSERPR